ncbi:hypothetical protein BDV97DRAFT_373496 [Delphinella strobiligena]|nr:hypothetical protein BDV97DRAFT_373496 [Delphinella strobiligena]
MAARNPDAAFNSDTNGFHPSKPREDNRIETSGHKPGVLVGNDAKPEFHVQTLPAGTAPPSKTFEPQNETERPPYAADPDAKPPTASETLGGATSGDVHTGLGHPGQGQSSQELHHDGQPGRKNPGAGGAEGRGGEHVQQSSG